MINASSKIKNEQMIWRYMDFAKFISMLDKKSLHFTRGDKLGDPFEGSFPPGNVKKVGTIGEQDVIRGRTPYFKNLRKHTVVNSWHMNDGESDAMWKLYLKSDEGIVIQSTYGRLKKVLNDNVQYDEILLREVLYGEEYVYENPPAPYFNKKKCFKHEEEVRAIIQIPKNEFLEVGIDVPVDLNVLIENVYLAPTCADWQHEVAKSIGNKYGLNREITYTPLHDIPIF